MISPSVKNGFALYYRKNNNNVNFEYLIRTGTNADGIYYCSEHNGNGTNSYTTTNWNVANNPQLLKIRIKNGNVTIKIANWNSSLNTTLNTARYIGIASWNTAKTISYTDLKVIPL